MIWTGKTKSLLPSLYKRPRLPRDLAKRGDLPARSRFGEGRGRFSEAYVFFIMDSIANTPPVFLFIEWTVPVSSNILTPSHP